MLTNGALLLWKADIRSTKSAWLPDAVVFGPLYSMRSELLFFVVSLVLMAGTVVVADAHVGRARGARRRVEPRRRAS